MNILYLEQAKVRKKLINSIHYDLNISIDTKNNSNNFFVDLRIFFNANSEEETFLDCDEVTTEKITLFENNGISKYDQSLKDNKIFFKTKKGKNELHIKIKKIFSTIPDGFYKSFDNITNKTFYYTNLEPFKAHFVFPCFDQPDLKATYELSVLTTEKLNIISNSEIVNESNIENEGVNFFTTSFKTNKIPFSTYLFCLVIGDFAKFTDEFINCNGKKIPLSIYCKPSIKDYFEKHEKEQWFHFTKECMAELEKYFDLEYPFIKYDQVFIPEFSMNTTAMENVGCVTFDDRLIIEKNEKQINISDEIDKINVLFHEMVHMWFGNLTTLEWWDDLWLNESFADFLSYYIMEKVCEQNPKYFTPESIKMHLMHRKLFALSKDTSLTTHPIVNGNTDNTEKAVSAFDGISYAKGANALNQLKNFMGENEFKLSIQKYLSKFYASNANLKSFINCIPEDNIKQLFESLLGEKSEFINSLHYELDKEDNNIIIWQDYYTSAFIKKYRNFEIKLFYFQENNVDIINIDEKIEIIYDNKTIINYSDIYNKQKKQHPDFVLLNSNDIDYAISFNVKDFVLNNLNTISKKILLLQNKDPISCYLLLRNLYMLILNNEINVKDMNKISQYLSCFYISSDKDFEIISMMPDLSFDIYTMIIQKISMISKYTNNKIINENIFSKHKKILGYYINEKLNNLEYNYTYLSNNEMKNKDRNLFDNIINILAFSADDNYDLVFLLMLTIDKTYHPEESREFLDLTDDSARLLKEQKWSIITKLLFEENLNKIFSKTSIEPNIEKLMNNIDIKSKEDILNIKENLINEKPTNSLVILNNALNKFRSNSAEDIFNEILTSDELDFRTKKTMMSIFWQFYELNFENKIILIDKYFEKLNELKNTYSNLKTLLISYFFPISKKINEKIYIKRKIEKFMFNKDIGDLAINMQNHLEKLTIELNIARQFNNIL